MLNFDGNPDTYYKIINEKGIRIPNGDSEYSKLFALLKENSEMITYKKYADLVAEWYQRVLFNWHCLFYFDFVPHLNVCMILLFPHLCIELVSTSYFGRF